VLFDQGPERGPDVDHVPGPKLGTTVGSFFCSRHRGSIITDNTTDAQARPYNRK
jgi:hypothetical protein